jgi:hypothetical protein
VDKNPCCPKKTEMSANARPYIIKENNMYCDGKGADSTINII